MQARTAIQERFPARSNDCLVTKSRPAEEWSSSTEESGRTGSQSGSTNILSQRQNHRNLGDKSKSSAVGKIACSYRADKTREIDVRGVQFNAQVLDHQEVTEMLLTALSYEPRRGRRIPGGEKGLEALSPNRTDLETLHLCEPPCGKITSF